MGRMKPRKQFEAMGTISLWVQNLKQALRNLRSHGWQAGISACLLYTSDAADE